MVLKLGALVHIQKFNKMYHNIVWFRLSLSCTVKCLLVNLTTYVLLDYPKKDFHCCSYKSTFLAAPDHMSDLKRYAEFKEIFLKTLLRAAPPSNGQNKMNLVSNINHGMFQLFWLENSNKLTCN